MSQAISRLIHNLRLLFFLVVVTGAVCWFIFWFICNKWKTTERKSKKIASGCVLFASCWLKFVFSSFRWAYSWNWTHMMRFSTLDLLTPFCSDCHFVYLSRCFPCDFFLFLLSVWLFFFVFFFFFPALECMVDALWINDWIQSIIYSFIRHRFPHFWTTQNLRRLNTKSRNFQRFVTTWKYIWV